MDQQIEQQQIVPEQPIVNQPKQANNILMMFVGFFLIMIFGIGGYFLGKSSNKSQVIIPTISPTPTIFLSPTNIPNNNTVCTQDAKQCPDGSYVSRTGPKCEFSPCPIISPTKSSIINQSDWIRTKIMGTFSFEYPSGWHVAALWPDKMEDGIQIWFNSEPINFAPRGGSLDDLFIVNKNGLPNPEEVLQQNIDKFKAFATSYSEEEINTNIGTAKYIKGSAQIMGDIQEVEAYFLMIQAENSSDKQNYQVVSSQIGSKSKNAPILKKIIQSIQKN